MWACARVCTHACVFVRETDRERRDTFPVWPHALWLSNVQRQDSAVGFPMSSAEPGEQTRQLHAPPTHRNLPQPFLWVSPAGTLVVLQPESIGRLAKGCICTPTNAEKKKTEYFCPMSPLLLALFFYLNLWTLFMSTSHHIGKDRLAGQRSQRMSLIRTKTHFGTQTSHGAMRSINIQIDVRALMNTGLKCTCLEGPCKVVVKKTEVP